MLGNMDEQFEVGDFVFAKMKGHPHWPATISQIETVHASGYERTKYNVYFYGSHQMSMIKVESIVKFDDHYDFLKKKYASNPKFISALEELEADLETRKSYLKSLSECLINSARNEGLQDKPDYELVSASEESDHEQVTALNNRFGSEVSSGFNESFDSDEEEHAAQDQKYEIISMEKVLFPGTSDTFLIISLGFSEENLQEDFEFIKNELHMMRCYVKLERLPKNAEHVFSNVKNESLVYGRARCAQQISGKRRKKRKWKARDNKITQFNKMKPSLTYIAAEAVKRRRHKRKRTHFRDENRLRSLRQRNADPGESENISDPLSATEESDNIESPDIIESTSVISCPICQAQFSSSLDFKQHSFNIHIMGL